MSADPLAAAAKHPYTLVDFYAEWCEPCKWVVPLLKQIEAHYEGKVRMEKINIDLHPETARTLHIMSVPTLVLFKNGEEVWRIRGFDTFPKMIAALDAFVK